MSAVEWAVKAARHGAGEILLTSIDTDGNGEGDDLALTCAVAKAVSPRDRLGRRRQAAAPLRRVDAGADAALVASIVDGGRSYGPR